METTISLRSYVTGFIFSAILILAAYADVVYGAGSRGMFIAAIFTLAIIQVFVQLKYFLHLSFRSASRMQISILVVTTIGIAILVGGSLWIMYHLNYNMTPSQMDSMVIQGEGMHM